MPKKKTEKTTQQGTETDKLIDLIDLQAKKLAVLLASSDMPEEIQEAWISLLPVMTPDQIDRLMASLEVSYAESATEVIDSDFKNEILALEEEQAREAKSLDASAEEHIEKITKVYDVLNS